MKTTRIQYLFAAVLFASTLAFAADSPDGPNNKPRRPATAPATKTTNPKIAVVLIIRPGRKTGYGVSHRGLSAPWRTSTSAAAYRNIYSYLKTLPSDSKPLFFFFCDIFG